MEEARHTALDRFCERIGEIRDELNTLRGDEGDQSRSALSYMRAAGVTSYRHAGVELVRVPGEEKLRVRTSKEQATAETEEAPQPEPAADGEEMPF